MIILNSFIVPKNIKDPLGFFKHPLQKKQKIEETSYRGGPVSFVQFCMLRQKRNSFMVQFPGPSGTILPSKS